MRVTMNNAVRHGTQLYRTMRHHASVWDGRIQAAAHLYGSVLQPALRMQGVDTGNFDKTLKTGYDHYNTLSQNVRDGVDVVDGVTRHLRGGYSHT